MQSFKMIGTKLQEELRSQDTQGKCLFVCVRVLRPSQPNGVMSSAVSLLTTRLLGRFSPLSR